MGLFKKFKDILFDEEEYTEQIKITPEMRNEQTPSKENDIRKKETPVEVKRPVKQYDEEFSSRPVQKEEIKQTREIPKERVRNDEASEREVFKSEPTFQFLDFDEDEFNHQVPVSKPRNNELSEPVIPKRSTNVFEYEKKKKVEKRTDYGRFEKIETMESIERKRFKPSPIISPVYGILNQDYVKEEIMNRNSLGNSRTPDLNEVRQKAFGDSKNTIVEEMPEKRTYYEEKTVTISRPEEKQKKVKTIDELLEDTSDVEIDANITDFDDEYDELPRLNKRNDIKEDKEITKEMEIVDSSEDTLENDLFDLIDSMYDNKEDGD